MSKDDWQVGDLALCVNDTPDPTPWGACECNVRRGAVYTVSHIYRDRFGLGLNFVEEFAPANEDYLAGYCATRFRKIRPHEADEEDRETIRLLTEKKEPVA